MRQGLGLLITAILLAGCDDRGTLELTIRDVSSGDLTPARVELLSEDGTSVVPEDALPIFEDCGRVPVHNWVPGSASIQALWGRHRDIANPYTGTTQFYSDGSIQVELEPGRYAITATKGIEYETASAEVVIVERETESVRLDLERWIDLPREGWYGADDHLHIPRPHPRFDPLIATWMQAEDIHVAHLLQMGLARDVHITPQHGFGPGSVYRTENTLLLTGQENPRTHVLGHSIILGARQWIDMPGDYLLYDRFWRESHDQGAINGYAHWSMAGAEEGLAVWGHEELLDFIEVLNLGFPFYERWYETLNLGIRMAPTAGTDFPCLPSLPGRERFYARLDGPLDPEGWIEAVRRGRTFVTNGPAIDLKVDGATAGDDLRLPAPASVRIRGRVRFDRHRDDITRLELIHGGVVAVAVDAPNSAGEITIDTSVAVSQSTWFALRATGLKRNETEVAAARLLRSMLILKRRSNDVLIGGLPAGSVERPAAAHTAAIFVTVDGTPPLAEKPRAKAVAEAWLSRLDELQDRFRDDRIHELARFPGRGDGVCESGLHANREDLLRAIESARRFYSDASAE